MEVYTEIYEPRLEDCCNDDFLRIDGLNGNLSPHLVKRRAKFKDNLVPIVIRICVEEENISCAESGYSLSGIVSKETVRLCCFGDEMSFIEKLVDKYNIKKVTLNPPLVKNKPDIVTSPYSGDFHYRITVGD